MPSSTHTRVSSDAISAAKSGADLPALIGAHIKLARHAGTLVGLCPFHAERSPSFHVYPDHWHCYGCGAHGDAIDWLARVQDMKLPEAVKYLGGADDFEQKLRAKIDLANRDPFSASLHDSELRKMAAARRIWDRGLPVRGTIAERYLKRRGLKPMEGRLRYIEALPCPRSGRPLPALVAAIHGAGDQPTAIQRIWIDPDTGSNFRPDGKSLRMTLGPMGSGAWKPEEPGSRLGLAESVEKAMACIRLFSVPTWGVCGARRFRSVSIPPQVAQIDIYADADETGWKEASAAQDHWIARGVKCSIIMPPGEKDWDDVRM